MPVAAVVLEPLYTAAVVLSLKVRHAQPGASLAIDHQASYPAGRDIDPEPHR
tara:strand:- start:130 stop:285 length:156 start_codon:yes stop_codon:yes gene_type:complete